MFQGSHTYLGGVTFTGSVVAFLKLAGRMSSKPVRIPGPRHLVNSSLLGLNVATMGTFLTLAPGSPIIAACCLAGSTVLSFLKGYTTTAAIGGADMPVVITVLNAYSGFALVAEGFMLDNPLLTSVGALIGVSGSILSYIMVCFPIPHPQDFADICILVRGYEPVPD